MVDLVLVIVGEWECGDTGEWDFVIEKNVMAQSVLLSDDLDYMGLQRQIASEFGITYREVEANLTFWMPLDLSVLPTNRAPPVCITSDRGLAAFREARRGRKWLSVFVSFASPQQFNHNTEHVGGAHQHCVFEGEASGRLAEWGSIPLTDSTPSSGEYVDHTQDNRKMRVNGEHGFGDIRGHIHDKGKAICLESSSKESSEDVNKEIQWRGKGKALRFESDSESIGDDHDSGDSLYSEGECEICFWQEFIQTMPDEGIILEHAEAPLHIADDALVPEFQGLRNSASPCHPFQIYLGLLIVCSRRMLAHPLFSKWLQKRDLHGLKGTTTRLVMRAKTWIMRMHNTMFTRP